MMEKYVSYLNDISVDAEQHEKIMARLNQKPVPLYKKPLVLRYTGIAACAAVLIFCLFTIPGLFRSSDSNIAYDPANTAIVGLPVENFSLSEMHNHADAASFAIIHEKISDFFAFGAPDFILVRVLQTEEWIDERLLISRENQKATVQVLSTVWSKAEMPLVFSITQSKYGGCCLGENTNLLREGGVYFLPVEYWEDGDTWFIQGDNFVLFEVDDNGLIWSHSQYEGFNRFDGMDAGVVAEAVAALTSDENIYASSTMFGRIVRDWGVFVEVTVLGTDPDIDQFKWEQKRFIVVDDMISVGQNKNYTWQPKVGEEISVVIDRYNYLEVNSRYLMILDPSTGGPFIEDSKVAKINPDGTITALSNVYSSYINVFTEYDGRTVEYMKEEAERAIAWYKEHME